MLRGFLLVAGAKPLVAEYTSCTASADLWPLLIDALEIVKDSPYCPDKTVILNPETAISSTGIQVDPGKYVYLRCLSG